MHGSAPQLSPITAPSLVLPGVAHAFFTREGGVSTGIYRGLNTGIGSNDAREAVLENRARAAKYLGTTLARLATPYQVHGTDAVIVENAWQPGQGPKADAVVTDRPGIALGVGAADCGPVLFADSNMPHNDFLWVGAQGGLPALLSLLVIMVGAVWQAWKRPDIAGRYALAATLIALIASSVNSAMRDAQIGLALLWIAMVYLRLAQEPRSVQPWNDLWPGSRMAAVPEAPASS